MIKHLMRNSLYKNFDKESQERIWYLNSKFDRLKLLCTLFWGFIYIFQCIPIFIINLCENIEFSIFTQRAICVFWLLELAGFLVFMKFFKNAILTFQTMLATKLHFHLYTIKGQAICKNDFGVIKQLDNQLYTLIETQLSKGYCYSICFKICKLLKKGSIEFIASKIFTPHENENENDKDFTMHVLYVNNGWAFDTYSSRQYPIEKMHKIWEAKVYKTFSFDDIQSKSYEEFMDEQYHNLAKWCNNNNCSIFKQNTKKQT